MLAISGLSLVVIVFLFGRTAVKKSTATDATLQASPSFDILQYINKAKQSLPTSQTITLGKLENSVTRGDVLTQQINANYRLAEFWKDSVRIFEPYAYYNAEAAKLDNSEKNLTFAARLYLEFLRHEPENSKREWMASEAIKLFEKAITLNPADKQLKIDQGACYIYGYAAIGKADKAMNGILMLRDMVDKDTVNLEAQMLVGIGGVISGQYDKAINRLLKVVTKQPGNVEAASWIADAYAGAGNKAEAIKWYTLSKKLINNPEYSKEADRRISDLK